MKFKYICFISIIASLLLAGCGGGSVQLTQTPQPTKEPEISEVLLKVNDLPGGYKQLTDEEISRMMWPDPRGLFSSITEDAPSKSIVFLNQSQNEFGIIVVLLAHPVSTKTITSLVAGMSQPDLFMTNMKFTLKPEYSGIGNESLGLLTEVAGDHYFQEFIVAYRNNSVMAVTYLYTDNPKVDLKSLAQKLDTNTKLLTTTSTELPSPKASPTPIPSLTVKVMSYNILWGAGVDREFDENMKAAGQYSQYGQSRLLELLSVIKELDPDILGIQEGAGWDRGTPSVIQKVAEELNMNYFLAKGAASELNVMLLSKFKIIEAENLSPEVGNVGALRAKLTTPDGQQLNVFVVHLDPFSSNTRFCEINTLIQYMQQNFQQRTIVMGDFNNVPDSYEVRNLKEAGMELVAIEQSWMIDQIWISPSINWSKTDWFKSFSPPRNISDHRPVGAEITIFPNTLSLPTFTPIPPMPTIVLEPLVSDFLTNPQALRLDTFEDTCTKPKWNSDWTTEKFTDGTIAVEGEEFWKAGVSRNKHLSEGQGVILRFKFEKGTEANIFIDSGDWSTDPYRRFGMNIRQDLLQTDLWQGKTGMGGKNLNGNFKPKLNTWYNLMIVVSKNGEFLEVVWNPSDPTQVFTYHERLGQKWAGLTWRFTIGANTGKVLIDDYSEIVFDKIN